MIDTTKTRDSVISKLCNIIIWISCFSSLLLLGIICIYIWNPNFTDNFSFHWPSTFCKQRIFRPRRKRHRSLAYNSICLHSLIVLWPKPQWYFPNLSQLSRCVNEGDKGVVLFRSFACQYSVHYKPFLFKGCLDNNQRKVTADRKKILR